MGPTTPFDLLIVILTPLLLFLQGHPLARSALLAFPRSARVRLALRASSAPWGSRGGFQLPAPAAHS
jgi:hypothetical protein